MRKLIFLMFPLFTLGSLPAQKVIVDNSFFLTTDSTYVQYIGLKKGDVVNLKLKTEGKKELEEVHIVEYSTQSEVLKEFKPKLRYRKEITIYNTGVYLITLVNKKGKKKVELELTRTPSDEKDEFDPTVYWRNVVDSVPVQVEQQYLALDTVVVNDLIAPTKIALNGNLITPWKGGGVQTNYNIEVSENTTHWYYYFVVAKEEATIDSIMRELPLQVRVGMAMQEESELPNVPIVKFVNELSGNAFANIVVLNEKQLKKMNKGKDGGYTAEYSRLNASAGLVVVRDIKGKVGILVDNDMIFKNAFIYLEAFAVEKIQEFATRMVVQYNVTLRRIPYLKAPIF